MSSSQRFKDLLNKFNGTPNPSKSLHEQTTDVRCFDKNETGNYSNASKSRSIQRECLTNDETIVTASAIIVQKTATTLDFKGVVDHEAKAHELREKTEKTLEKNEMEFVQVEQAQTDAQIASEKANEKTETALKHQEIGQELLAEAGAKLIEAGAKLQQEAMINQNEVPYNVHEQGEILQTTCVSSSAGIETAAATHDFQTFRQVKQISETTP
uniref:Uncharacterized protein n=1 Tax=Panagrolaimus davidi TaxID=227884 RepID=A0A914PF52_9BILA